MASCQLNNNNVKIDPKGRTFEGKMELWELYTAEEVLGSTAEGPLVLLNNKLKADPKYRDTTMLESDTVLSDSLNNEYNPLLRLIGIGGAFNIDDPFSGVVNIKDTLLLMEMLHGEAAKQVLPKSMYFAWSDEATEGEDGIKYFILYALKSKSEERKSELNTQHIKAAFPMSNPDGAGFGISVEFNKKGTETWRQMTAANINRCLAICLDGRVMSAPKVMEEISGGKTVISGNFNAEEAAALAKVLHPGK